MLFSSKKARRVEFKGSKEHYGFSFVLTFYYLKLLKIRFHCFNEIKRKLRFNYDNQKIFGKFLSKRHSNLITHVFQINIMNSILSRKLN